MIFSSLCSSAWNSLDLTDQIGWVLTFTKVSRTFFQILSYNCGTVRWVRVILAATGEINLQQFAIFKTFPTRSFWWSLQCSNLFKIIRHRGFAVLWGFFLIPLIKVISFFFSPQQKAIKEKNPHLLLPSASPWCGHYIYLCAVWAGPHQRHEFSSILSPVAANNWHQGNK